MRRTTQQSWFVIGIVAVALSVSACGDSGGGSGGGGGDSPEALIEEARSWADGEEMGKLIGVLAPSDRPVMAFMGLFLAKMMPQMAGMAAQFNPDPAAKEDATQKLKGMTDGIAAVMKKHGIDAAKLEDPMVMSMMGSGEPDPDKVREFMSKNFPDLKHGLFMTDVFDVVKQFGDKKQTEMMAPSFKGELQDLKVDGDRATGVIDGDPVVFVREGGRWFISLTESMKK